MNMRTPCIEYLCVLKTKLFYAKLKIPSSLQVCIQRLLSYFVVHFKGLEDVEGS